MADIIDSRELDDELNELQDRDEAAIEAVRAAREDGADFDPDDIDPLNEDEQARLAELRKFADAVGSEWPHGETLIPEENFEDYAQQLADDLGYTRNIEGQGWPMRHIDWAAAADELRDDYNEHVFDGINYLFRAG